MKPTSGRKKESAVWEFFNYDAVKDKSCCLAKCKDNKICGKEIAGKNSTNVKNDF